MVTRRLRQPRTVKTDSGISGEFEIFSSSREIFRAAFLQPAQHEAAGHRITESATPVASVLRISGPNSPAQSRCCYCVVC
ncbi:hypothetical protein BWU74_00625 [Paraburkholderia caledonica]|nr:hypothetical protein BWU74_00625 [Burkholderia sp. Bk]